MEKNKLERMHDMQQPSSQTIGGSLSLYAALRAGRKRMAKKHTEIIAVKPAELQESYPIAFLPFFKRKYVWSSSDDRIHAWYSQIIICF